MERFCQYCIYVELQLEVGVLRQKGQSVFCWAGREVFPQCQYSLLLNDPRRVPLSLAAEEHCKLQRKDVRMAAKDRLKTHCPVCACGQMPTMWTLGICIGQAERINWPNKNTNCFVAGQIWNNPSSSVKTRYLNARKLSGFYSIFFCLETYS